MDSEIRKNSKGITLVALVITIVVMLILLTVSIRFGEKQIDKARLEDIKTEMIAIKSKALIIAEKNSFDSTTLVGETQVSAPGATDEGSFYRWYQNDLDSQGLDTIKITEAKYYLVRYFTKDENDKDIINVEVYYSEGYNDNGTLKYSLTEIENIQ